jgi:hypothetical protein
MALATPAKRKRAGEVVIRRQARQCDLFTRESAFVPETATAVACYFCHRMMHGAEGREAFCEGCQTHVCDGCDRNGSPSGKHPAAEHRRFG